MEKYASLASVWKAQGKGYGKAHLTSFGMESPGKRLWKSALRAMENLLAAFKILLQVLPQGSRCFNAVYHSTAQVYHSSSVYFTTAFTSSLTTHSAARRALPQPLPPTLPHARPSAHFTTAFTTGEGEPSALTLWRLCLSYLFLLKRERINLFLTFWGGDAERISPKCGDTTLRKHLLPPPRRITINALS